MHFIHPWAMEEVLAMGLAGEFEVLGGPDVVLLEVHGEVVVVVTSLAEESGVVPDLVVDITRGADLVEAAGSLEGLGVERRALPGKFVVLDTGAALAGLACRAAQLGSGEKSGKSSAAAVVAVVRVEGPRAFLERGEYSLLDHDIGLLNLASDAGAGAERAEVLGADAAINTGESVVDVVARLLGGDLDESLFLDKTAPSLVVGEATARFVVGALGEAGTLGNTGFAGTQVSATAGPVLAAVVGVLHRLANERLAASAGAGNTVALALGGEPALAAGEHADLTVGLALAHKHARLEVGGADLETVGQHVSVVITALREHREAGLHAVGHSGLERNARGGLRACDSVL